MRYSLYTMNNGETHIDRNLSIDDIKVLLLLYGDDPDNRNIGIRPEMELYDIVLNKKTQDVGEVLSTDTDIKYIDAYFIDYIEDIFGYVSIVNSNYDMAMWKISDLIVIGDSTIN